MQTPTLQGSTFSELVIEIFRANGLLLEAGDQLAHPAGLSSARWQVLGVVEHGPISVAHVARSMGLARQSVQQTADGLEQEGFILYGENPFHRRSKLMQITPKGRAALDDILQRQAVWASAMAEDLHVEDLRTAVQVLHHIRKNVGQFLDRTPQTAG